MDQSTSKLNLKPPKWNEIDTSLQLRYSMYKQCPIYDQYLDSTYTNMESKFIKKEDVDSCVQDLSKRVSPYDKYMDTHPLEGYGDSTVFLLEALDEYPIKNQTIVNIGNSGGCWFESMILSKGGICSTIEYNKLETDHPDLNFITVEEFKNNPKTFDCAFSISSFEHDGLGRYGDPLDPEGDLKAMQNMKSIVKPGGLLFLVIPIGKDRLVWNAHRIYGELRLPYLFHNWELVKAFGASQESLTTNLGLGVGTQPVFVLKNI